MNPNSSKGSARGTLVSSVEQIDLQHWSELERKVALCLLADPNVRELRCQWPTVTYRDEHGVKHTHRFDYCAIMIDGSMVCYNVKHVKDVAEVDVLFRLLRQQGVVADPICVTELQATDGRAANAREMLTALENYNRVDHADAVKTLVGIHGGVRFHHLIKDARNEADRRSALLVLLQRGVLVMRDVKERLEDFTMVYVDQSKLEEELEQHAQYAA